MHIYDKIHVLIITFLLHVSALNAPFSVRTFVCSKLLFCLAVLSVQKVLAEDGAVSAETCRGELIIYASLLLLCAFYWCTEDMIYKKYTKWKAARWVEMVRE
jgi:hypothetical protein